MNASQRIVTDREPLAHCQASMPPPRNPSGMSEFVSVLDTNRALPDKVTTHTHTHSLTHSLIHQACHQAQGHCQIVPQDVAYERGTSLHIGDISDQFSSFSSDNKAEANGKSEQAHLRDSKTASIHEDGVNSQLSWAWPVITALIKA